MNVVQDSRQRTFSTGKLPVVCLFVFVLAAIAAGQPVVRPQTKPTSEADGTILKLGDRILLTNEQDGFMSVSRIRYSPNGKHFVVIACGFECNDNVGFLFNADGSGKRRFTARWDFIFQDKVEWSADGKKLFYYRINSSGAESPKTAPASGWVEMDVASGRKAAARTRKLNPGSTYAVFGVSSDDFLNIREAPGAKAKITGKLTGDAKGIRVTGEKQKVGKDIWVKITHQHLTGWVNQNFLYELAKDQ